MLLLLLLLILSSCFSIGISVYDLIEQYHAIVPSFHPVIVVNFVVINDDVCFVVVMNDVK